LNLQREFSLQVGTWQVLIKLGTSLLYLHNSQLQRITLIDGMGQCNTNRFIFGNLYEFKSFRANRLVKEFATIFFNLKEQLLQCLSVFSSGVQLTVVVEVIDKNGDDISRLVFIQNDVFLNIPCNIGCTMSFLSPHWMAEHFTISCNILLQ